RQLAVGRQAVARGEAAARHVVGQGVRQRDVEGLPAVPEIGRPTCHGDNLRIDRRLCQYYFACMHRVHELYRYNIGTPLSVRLRPTTPEDLPRVLRDGVRLPDRYVSLLLLSMLEDEYARKRADARPGERR